MIITGGKFKGRKIIAPDEKITRPTLSKVRQGVFNVLYSLIGEFDNKNFLDLFGGSGIIGLEAISRGFTDVVVIEKNLKVSNIIKKNYSTLGLKPNLKICDSLKFLKQNESVYDVVYVDPPFYSGVYEEVFSILSTTLNDKSIIIAEHSLPLNIENYRIIKEKNYGGKFVTFYQK